MIAVYPGSFDPITMGHIDLIQRMSLLYDEVVVLVSQSTEKKYLFTVDERIELIQKSLAHLKNITVESSSGLTVDYLKKKNAKIIIRGLRAVVDFEYENTMASMNKKIAPDVETLLVFASPQYYFISSRGVKEVAKHQGPLAGLVTEPVKLALKEKFKN